ncbi:extracellular solute-binding protein [Cellulomonas sp. ATA003]|uniref:ABC transporter substrate-binding protein n=1 Tax=Cellulomonas sp. ATA003 TaxID=3073064 RepID=UPI002873C57D|nr:extracellular solute-binding protein [Cellulomonas sp. ATA003]WNB86063.1 extracellular solute-binding protein [Cellulomonas sp. ATA003]
MRTHTRRVLGGITAGTLALTLAACGGSDEGEGEGDGTVDAAALEDNMVGAMEDYSAGDTFVATEPVEFGLLYRDHPNYPLQDDWPMLQKLEENQNVTFDITTAPLSDWEQRRSLLIGAGDAPCIIPVTYAGQENQFVSSGAILPVSDYVEYMPNFQAKVEEWELEPELDTLRQADGKYYLLPGILEQLRYDYTLGIRTDVFEAAGAETAPETWDDLRESFEAVKAAHPDQYVLSDRFSVPTPLGALFNVAAPNFGTVGGWGFGEGLQWDEAAGEFSFAGATDEYRSMVEYFHGLVEAGLLDPESFTQDDDTAVQKLTSEQSYAITTNSQEILRHRETLDTTVGAGNYQLNKIRVPAGPAGDLVAGTRMESGMMISADCAENENFVAMLQFIDWLYYSDEGLEFAKWGVEGETFTTEGDGTRVLNSDITIQSLNPGAPTNLQVDLGYHNGVFMLAQGSTQDLVTSMLSEEEQNFQEVMATKEQAAVAPPHPLDELELEQASLYQTALTDYVTQNTLAFILGQRDLSEWDAYVAELEGQNMTAYVDIMNAAQERFAENNG